MSTDVHEPIAASSSPPTSTTQVTDTTTQPITEPLTESGSAQPVSTPQESPTRGSSSEGSHLPYGPVRTDTSTALAQALAAPASAPSPPPPSAAPTSQRTRRQSTAIGPPTDQPEITAKDEDQSGPRLELTLLLTNGARHPFILDAKYLAKRNVDVQGNDPFNLSVYKLKELILREWRDEWEQKPSNPSYIRLISFGKLLDDKTALKDLKFNRTERNVVHMTIKPQDFIDEDEGRGVKGGFSSGRPGEEGRSPGCRCVIM